MNILVVGLNYSPEPIGIGPFTAGVAEAFVEAGHHVEVVAAKPYYPQWKTLPGFVRPFYMRSTEAGVAVTRVPIYVPEVPSGLRRLIHYASFIAASVVPVARVLRRARPDVVLAIAPSLLSVMVLQAFTQGRDWLGTPIKFIEHFFRAKHIISRH